MMTDHAPSQQQHRPEVADPDRLSHRRVTQRNSDTSARKRAEAVEPASVDVDGSPQLGHGQVFVTRAG